MSGDADTLIVVRNGIFSEPSAMVELEKYLKGKFPGCSVAVDQAFRWEDPVLHSGIDLAALVLGWVRKNPGIDKIVFAGHSQGGLVCRVAVAALCAYESLLDAIRFRTSDSYFNGANSRLLELKRFSDEQDRAAKAVHSVLMLGTPNSGAFTYGQFALQGTIVLHALKKISGLAGKKNFDELTTEKLFRILQKVRVREVRYVSISGSAFNRYKAVGWSIIGNLPVISRLAPALALPNDTVVEDISVDLRQAPLPCEIADLDAQYTHVRSYTECIMISHTIIHSDQNVFDALDLVLAWQ